MSNFTFLATHWSDLAKLGDLSEKYVYSDPNTSVIKQGMLAEVSNKIAKRLGGEIVRKDPLIPREITEGWGNDDAINEAEIPCCNVYEICR